MIGGNTKAILQIKQNKGKNLIGEAVQDWIDAYELTGWLDLSNGDSPNNFNAKIQESTHVFVMDYKDLKKIKTDESRMIMNDEIYNITLIDDPMELHQHLEIFLKYIGGGLNGK